MIQLLEVGLSNFRESGAVQKLEKRVEQVIFYGIILRGALTPLIFCDRCADIPDAVCSKCCAVQVDC